MRRRIAIFGLLTAPLWPMLAALAQDAAQLPKVAFLYPSTRAHLQGPGMPLNNVLKGLADLGYLDGQNVEYEFRFANHELERLPSSAAELVAWQPDALWTFTWGGARAAAGATSTVPIVVGPVSEVTMAALAPDFAHPPGNITGLTTTSQLLHEKCLQLLKEVAPGSKRVGVLINPLNPVWRDYPDVLNDAARALGIELVRVEARGAPEVDWSFAAMAAQKVDALFGLSDSTLIGADPTPARILELLAKQRLPSVSDENGFAREGGLLSLGPETMWRSIVALPSTSIAFSRAPKWPTCRSCCPRSSSSPST
jgi:putative ABC transport system substrate-binding protein